MKRILKPYNLALLALILFGLYFLGYHLHVLSYSGYPKIIGIIGVLLALPQILFSLLSIPLVINLLWSGLQSSKQSSDRYSKYIFSGVLIIIFQIIWLFSLGNGFIITN